MSVQPSSATRRRPPSLAGTLVPADTLSGQVWWFQPVAVVVALTAFGIYAFWAALQGRGYITPYLSPFYSPRVPWGGLFAPFWVLWVPLGFRASCYYYRKAYYRSFFWDPPACARLEPSNRNYSGERRFPFILNNFHRFFLYLSIIVLLFLWWDTIRAFDFSGHFGIGLGTVLMLINVVLLSFYTFSCHSFRHLVGGSVACFSCTAAGNTRHGLWQRISSINGRHPLFAWLSLTSLLVVDVYLRLLIAGVFTDPRWVA
ncbi:MAG: succinate dehydrogenase [Chloroflexi bacterium]|nr:succinate dehydrogenase [Chloroflexota bacterium]